MDEALKESIKGIEAEAVERGYKQGLANYRKLLHEAVDDLVDKALKDFYEPTHQKDGE